jgi:TfoX/Sxy family transcriptional regulator of competence genes
VQIPKASDHDKDYFRSLLPDDPGVVVKPMFGNLGAFVNGNMFAGLFGATVGVRLSDEDRATLEAVEGTGPFGPEGRPMGGYVGLPPQWVGDPGQATAWVARAHAHVAALPPKAPKAPKARRTTSRGPTTR